MVEAENAQEIAERIAEDLKELLLQISAGDSL
jgi:hypothetical protein